MKKKLLVGCAAGFGQDRTDSAGPIVETMIKSGESGVLVFEMLAERTLALSQLDRRNDSTKGYAPLLDPMVRPILRKTTENSIPIVSNFGAANPTAAAVKIQSIARELGLKPLRIAIIHGDDFSDPRGRMILNEFIDEEIDPSDLVSANVYLGAESIADALRAGAQVVVAGRVADPSLVLGPALAHFDWPQNDWQRLARATMAGHLLECGAQVTGGYFADPPFKPVTDLHAVGYPIAEIDSDGNTIITKPNGTGGEVSLRTVKEQLLYEVHDPAAYVTPDVVADISQSYVTQLEENRVALHDVEGHPRTDTLKALVCYNGGWLGEGEISYAGPNAEARARLAADIVQRRVGSELELRFDLIGVISVFGDDKNRAQTRESQITSNDVRLRIAGSHADRSTVEQMLREVTALYTCGPAGGGGVRTAIRSRLHSVSCLVPRDKVSSSFSFLE